MSYKNPTLTEIYAELHLEPGILPERSFVTLASELASKGLGNQEFVQAAVMVAQGKGQDLEPKIVPRIRCWDSDRTKLVQFSQDQYYVNLAGEYPGWDAFTEHLRVARESLTNALKVPVSFTYVSLVTIDKWKAGRAGFAIGQYLNCGGRFVPEWYADVAASSDITLGQGFHIKDGFNKAVRITVRTLDDDVQFQIVATFGEADQKGDFDTLLNRLHEESVECFEALITDRVRNEVMGGQR